MCNQLKLIQPYFVIHTDHYYKALCEKYGISHFYMYTIQEKEAIAAVPDGCIDLVFEYGNGSMRAMACGTVFAYSRTLFRYGYTYFGVRFLPGIRPRLLKAPLKELADREMELEPLTDCVDFLKRMEEQNSFESCARTFLEEYGRLEQQETAGTSPHALVRRALPLIYRTGGCIKIRDLEEQSGYSSRYINRAFHEELGYGPKLLCKIVQFQRLLVCMNNIQTRPAEEWRRLTDLALDCGYYDQPQLIRDFKKFASITPKAYEKLICRSGYNSHLVETQIV